MSRNFVSFTFTVVSREIHSLRVSGIHSGPRLTSSVTQPSGTLIAAPQGG